MVHDQIVGTVLAQLRDHRYHDAKEVVDNTIFTLQRTTGDPVVDASEVKSALLGLVRRQELNLTDDFKVRLKNPLQ